MIGPITTFWGKLRTPSHGRPPYEDDGEAIFWHPLVDHCADVAATFRALLDRPVVRRWLASFAGFADLNAVQCDRLAFLAALHDVGKVNIGFQKRSDPHAPLVGHVSPLILLLCDQARRSPERKRMLDALAFSDLAPWASDEDTFFELLLTAFSHHGRPVTPQANPGYLRYWQPSGGLDPIAGAAALRCEAEQWFPDAFGDAAPFPARPAFQHGFNGLLTLADWIASDEQFFPFSEEGDGDRFLWARERAEHVLLRLGLAADGARTTLGPTAPEFSTISDYKQPRDLQARVLELPITEGGSVTVLEAETGSGKTEAALARFIRLFHAGVVDGIYFALPTRTAATQIHERVRGAIERAFPDPETRPPVVLAVPGYLRVDDVSGERLSRFEVRWDQTAGQGHEVDPLLAAPDAIWSDDVRSFHQWRGWAAENSKRFLAGAVVVGTVDQVLLSALAVPHSHMRAAALARHLLVVDEVHASDAYMTRILETVLQRHVSAGGHALLMSATLGASARERLLAAGLPVDPPLLDDAIAAPYPLLTHVSHGIAPVQAIRLESDRVKTIRVELAPIAADPTAIATLALTAARGGARVLVVRNTVHDCVATQKAFEALVAGTRAADGEGGLRLDPQRDQDLLFTCAGVPAPHHSRYAREDRQKLDAELERRFGKRSPNRGCVAVATQTVQQSLDLDADLMLTDLCPMDVLLQRLGRLFRHERERPPGFEAARVVILVPADRDLGRLLRENGEVKRRIQGIGSVYRDLRILEATWRELEGLGPDAVLEIPRMCRPLVEATTHPDALGAIVNELRGPWCRHAEAIEGIFRAHGRIAGNHLARWDVPFPDAAFPDDGVRIATRLGAEDRIAVFEEPIPGPFGDEIQCLTIPHWLVKGADADARPEEIEAGEGSISFRFGTRRYRYDRLGLAPLDAPTPDEEEDDG